MDLRQGFSLPEGELLLANGQETQIPLFLDQGQPVQRIRADLTPLSSQQFSAWIGQHQAGEWRLQTRSTISVEIPNEEGLEGRIPYAPYRSVGIQMGTSNGINGRRRTVTSHRRVS